MNTQISKLALISMLFQSYGSMDIHGHLKRAFCVIIPVPVFYDFPPNIALHIVITQNALQNVIFCDCLAGTLVVILRFCSNRAYPKN